LLVTRLAETLGEQGKVVLRSLELTVQRVALDDGRVELGLGSGHVALKGRIAALKLFEAAACPRG
jgi:hypothetical protein